MHNKTQMAVEFRAAPEIVRRQAEELTHPVAELVASLKRRAPQVVVTCARGSSAHAATFGKHLIERHLGIPVSAVAPNIATVYRQPLRLEGQMFLAISQAGRSDDIVESVALARAAGALTVALVNDTDSPLAKGSDIVLPMMAGPELSVAATKTFVASLAALLRLAAGWMDDAAIHQALDRLPARLAAAAHLDWTAALSVVADAGNLVSIGRGPTLAVAREAALKLKETCGIHAEAFSGAEFQHGPIALIERHYPVIVFMPTDAAAEGLKTLVLALIGKGATVFATESDSGTPDALPALEPDHPDADAICLVQAFYALVIQIAQRRGNDVDRPPHLQKVTRTR
jgi:glucosamine--fructose-6-phosphate aminotransferase (isomerizing)